MSAYVRWVDHRPRWPRPMLGAAFSAADRTRRARGLPRPGV